jgi:hypothetical protein
LSIQITTVTHGLIHNDHARFHQYGTQWQIVDNIIEQPFFLDSRHSNHLQLVDILAYNVYHRYAYDNSTYDYFIRSIRKVRGYQPEKTAHLGLKVYP